MPEHSGMVLGFDFGLARIGVAVGSLEAHTANGLDLVPNRRGLVDWKAVDRLVADWHPSVLVVGEPKAQTGNDNRLNKAIQQFCLELKSRYGLPIAQANEDYTSACARMELREQRRAGVRGRITRGETDKMAATYILQTWLAQQDAPSGEG